MGQSRSSAGMFTLQQNEPAGYTAGGLRLATTAASHLLILGQGYSSALTLDSQTPQPSKVRVSTGINAAPNVMCKT